MELDDVVVNVFEFVFFETTNTRIRSLGWWQPLRDNTISERVEELEEKLTTQAASSGVQTANAHFDGRRSKRVRFRQESEEPFGGYTAILETISEMGSAMIKSNENVSEMVKNMSAEQNVCPRTLFATCVISPDGMLPAKI